MAAKLLAGAKSVDRSVDAADRVSGAMCRYEIVFAKGCLERSIAGGCLARETIAGWPLRRDNIGNCSVKLLTGGD